MKITDQGKGPGSGREVRRHSVFYVIGQQDEDQGKDQEGPAVQPFQAEGAEHRLHSDMACVTAYLLSWYLTLALLLQQNKDHSESRSTHAGV